MTQMTQQEKFEIKIKRANSGLLSVTVDGEESIVDGFEFTAPFGSGMEVHRIMRVELVPHVK